MAASEGDADPSTGSRSPWLLTTFKHVFEGALWAVLSLAACTSSESCAPERYGLAETPNGRQIAEQAIVLVDAMLPPDVPMRLRGTWPPSGWFPRLYFETSKHGKGFTSDYVTDKGFENGLRFRDAEIIPVYLIEPGDLGHVETAFVPDDRRCIFVNAGSIDRLSENFFLTGIAALEQHSSFDKSVVLALVLLHEVGHLHFHDKGSYGSPGALVLAEINQPRDSISNKEVRADRFASDMVNSAWASDEMHAPIDGPYGRAAIASNILRAVATGSNTHDLRVDPLGLLSGRERPETFRASGYSHLNLYLRLLIFAQQMDPDEQRLEELRWIDSHANSAVRQPR